MTDSAAGVWNTGVHVVGAPLERDRHLRARRARPGRGLDGGARQLAVGHDAARPGDGHPVPARRLGDADDGRVGRQLSHQILDESSRVHVHPPCRSDARPTRCNPWTIERGARTWAFVLLLLVLAAAPTAAQQPARPVDDQQVYEVAADLRCVVCQNLSVADSPSEMAGQMRAIVRERLAAGETPAQVRQYFVERYGDWILLAPPRRGFTLVVWIAPFVAVLVGLGLVALLLRKWTARRRVPPPPVDPAMRERIRRELESEP
jgi:cytochrome c-type biogenesis protein CcmH